MAAAVEREAGVALVSRGLKLTKEGSALHEGVARALDTTIFYSLLGLIALAAIPYGAVEPWWEALVECVVFVLAALAILESVISGTKISLRWDLVLPITSLIVFAILQTVPLAAADNTNGIQSGAWRTISADPFETRLVVLKFTAMTLVGWLLLRYGATRFRLRILIYLVLGIAAASAIFGLARQVMQHNSSSFLLVLPPQKGYGQFINANHFAVLMEMSFGLAAGFILGGGAGRHRLLIYLGLIVPIWGALVLSNSRGGIISMLCSVIFLLSLVAKSRRRRPNVTKPTARSRRFHNFLALRIFLATVLIIAICVSVAWVGGDPLEKRFDDEHIVAELSMEKDVATATRVRRIDIWRATLSLIRDHPVAGVGFGGYWTAITKSYAYTGQFRLRQAHNDYLELLASGGIIGLLLGLWLVVAILRTARQRLRSADGLYRAAVLGALTGMFAVAVHNLFDFGLHTTINGLVVAALVALLIMDRNKKASTVSGVLA